jgi:xanthine dehydrogenase accessory factor
VSGDGLGEKLHDAELEQAARRRGRSHVLELEGRSVFADVSVPPPRLFVYGAADTAEALCSAAKLLGWRTIVADARPRFATPERLPSADELLLLWPDEALAHVTPDAATAVVVLTHDDKFDLPLVRGVLRTDAFYVGWLGSRRNQERRRGLLLEDGVAEEDLERVSGPAGLDLGAASPEETAVSILAEILAVRTGRAGGPLRETSTRIHA